MLNSLYPFLVALWGLSSGALLSVFFWKGGGLVGSLLLLALLFRGRGFEPSLWVAWLRCARTPAFWLMCLGQADVLALTLAARFIEMSVAVVLLQLLPVVFILMMWLLHRREALYVRPGPGVLFLCLLAGTGAVLALSSERGGLAVVTLHWRVVAGVLLVLAAVGMGSLNAFSLRLAREVCDASAGAGELLCSSLVGAVLSLAVLLPVLLVIAPFVGDGAGVPRAVPLACLGALVFPLSAAMWRLANLVARDLAVNVISYFLPGFSLLWLAMAGLVGVVRVDLLVGGFVTVLIANVLLGLRGPVSSLLARRLPWLRG